MKTRTIRQTVSFKASPMAVYDMIMDSKRHQSLSGERAVISKKVGGAFTAWGSHLSGFNLALRPGKKIVQAWRATGWWPDHFSIAIFDIEETADASKLIFTQIGVPPERYSGHYRGWIETYWTPMKEIFATGTISDKARERVKNQQGATNQHRQVPEKTVKEGLMKQTSFQIDGAASFGTAIFRSK
jgi:activator of HSP90 ATPase